MGENGKHNTDCKQVDILISKPGTANIIPRSYNHYCVILQYTVLNINIP